MVGYTADKKDTPGGGPEVPSKRLSNNQDLLDDTAIEDQSQAKEYSPQAVKIASEFINASDDVKRDIQYLIGHSDEIPTPTNNRQYSTWADLDGLLGELRWVWPQWLACGYLHILAATTGEGKSTLCLRIAACFINGQEWPDGSPFTSDPGAVLWCEAEAGQGMNRDRAKEARIATKQVYSPLADPLADFRLTNPDHRVALLEMAMRPDIKLIIVDSLSGADPTAEKSTEDAKNVNWLAALARDIQKPILLTHHLRKRGLFDTDEVSLDRLRGISTILQYARIIWAIDTPDTNDKETKRLSVIKSNLTKKPEPLGFTINDKITFTAAPTAPKVETAMDRAAELLLSLLEKGPATSETVETNFAGAGISRRAMYDAKKALKIVSVRQGSTWYWSLPAKEKE